MAFEDSLQMFSVEDHFCLDRLFQWGSWMKECAFGISQKWPDIENTAEFEEKKWKFSKFSCV